MDIYIFDETDRLDQGLMNIIKLAARKTGEMEGLNPLVSVDIMIVDKGEIRNINRQRREIDSATDVLSFPMIDFAKGGIPKDGPVFLGDIVICIEKIFEQAKEYDHGAEREAGFLTAHGMLHLMGYDHMRSSEEKIMFQRQEEILNAIGLFR